MLDWYILRKAYRRWKNLKIVALNGLLGYGYSEEALNIAFSEKVDYLGVDAGSTDPGPHYLGSGKSFTDRGAVKRDLALALPKAGGISAAFLLTSSFFMAPPSAV